jgi:glutathione peroxidase-family protein
VRHDQYALAPVIGDGARPLFKWILTLENPGPKEGDIAPTWNFYKFLFSRRGELVATYDNRVYAGRDPAKEKWTSSPLIHAIEAELKK